MRILLTIHHRLEADAGAPGVTLALRDAYRAAGHEASTLSFEDMPARLGARAREALFPEFVASWLARHGRRFDVIDASTGDAWVWARVRRAAGARSLLVCRLHGLEHLFWEQERLEADRNGTPVSRLTRLYHGGLRLREVEQALGHSDACFFLNAGERGHAVGRLGVRPDRAFVVRNGVPAAWLDRPAPVAPDRGVRIAHIGSYAPRKGIRVLVPALSALLARRPELELTWLGSRVAAAQVLADHDPAVRDRVRVIESYRRDELPRLLEGHHVAVSASLAEGFSLALPEAMACGLAPVVTALDGPREIIRDGENGRLVPPADARALESALDEVVSSPALLARLRSAAQETAQALGWPAVANEQLRLYAMLLRRRLIP